MKLIIECDGTMSLMGEPVEAMADMLARAKGRPERIPGRPLGGPFDAYREEQERKATEGQTGIDPSLMKGAGRAEPGVGGEFHDPRQARSTAGGPVMAEQVRDRETQRGSASLGRIHNGDEPSPSQVHSAIENSAKSLDQERARRTATREFAGSLPKASFLYLVLRELERARQLHGPMHSEPEAWAVIFEELDEYHLAYRARHGGSPDACIKELVQTAAMCLKTAQDLYALG